MAHFARVDENDIVVEVIVADQEFIDGKWLGDPKQWIKCSYNTIGGEHLLDGEPLRKNFPSAGYVYDRKHDAFRLPQPFPSWTLNMETFLWEPPIPEPALPPNSNIFWAWNEDEQMWEQMGED